MQGPGSLDQPEHDNHVIDEKKKTCVDLRPFLNSSLERESLQKARQLLGDLPRQGLEPFWFDESLLLKCTRASAYDVSRAHEVFKNYVTWLKATGALTVTAQGLKLPLEDGIFRAPPGSVDKEGRQVFYLRISKLDMKQHKAEDVARLMHYMLTIQLERPEVQAQGLTFLDDQKGIGMRHFDLTFAKTVVKAVLNTFPIRFANLLIVNPNFVFKMVFPLLSHMIKPKIRSRFRVVSNHKRILDYISPENLLVEYGGTLKYDHAQWVSQRIALEASIQT